MDVRGFHTVVESPNPARTDDVAPSGTGSARGTCKHQHTVLFWIAWGRDVGVDGSVTETVTLVQAEVTVGIVEILALGHDVITGESRDGSLVKECLLDNPTQLRLESDAIAR